MRRTGEGPAALGIGALGLVAVLLLTPGEAAAGPSVTDPGGSAPPSAGASLLVIGSPGPGCPPLDAGSPVPPGSPAPSASVPGAGSPTPSGAPTPSGSPSASCPPSVAGSPTPSSPVVATVPLPECRYKDEPAVGDPATDWATIVLDTIYRLPADFAPGRLVSTKKAGLQRGFEVIPAVTDDLRALHEASIEADAEIAVRWAYRSYGEQAGAFAFWVRDAGRKRALEVSARPGHSEHQMGTAIDFRSADSLLPPWDYDDWGATKPGRWMAANAWRYGFVLSYPKGMTDETCYAYEPWHYRYVGRDVARAIHDSGLTPRRYLWETYQGRR